MELMPIGVLMKEKQIYSLRAVRDTGSPMQGADDPYSQNGAFHVITP